MNKIKIDLSLVFIFVISLYSGLVKELLLIYLVIVLHECGHLLFIKLFGGKITEFKLGIFGGLIKVENIHNLNKIQQFLINIGRPDYQFNNYYCI